MNRRNALATIADRLEAIEKILRNHTNAVSSAEKRDAEKKDKPTEISGEIWFPENIEKNRSAEQAGQHATQRWIARGTWAATIAAIVYAGIAACQTHWTQQATIAAQGQLTEMRRQTEISERPWISVQASPQFLFFVGGPQAGLALKLSVTNVGKSIAKDIRVDAELFPITPVMGGPVSGVDATSNEMKLCNPLRVAAGLDLFPNTQPAERVIDISTEPQSLASHSREAAYPREASHAYVGFYVVGCVTYRSSFDNEPRQTRFAYDLMNVIPRHGKSLPIISNGGGYLMTGFQVGINVPGDQIKMYEDILGINDAN